MGMSTPETRADTMAEEDQASSGEQATIRFNVGGKLYKVLRCLLVLLRKRGNVRIRETRTFSLTETESDLHMFWIMSVGNLQMFYSHYL
jgi:hypothetical protein